MIAFFTIAKMVLHIYYFNEIFYPIIQFLFNLLIIIIKYVNVAMVILHICFYSLIEKLRTHSYYYSYYHYFFHFHEFHSLLKFHLLILTIMIAIITINNNCCSYFS